MASDYLLELDGIKGESKDDKHPGTIEISSWSWGVSNPAGASSAPGGRTGKASFQDFSFTKKEDSTSPVLFLNCASGQHIKKATLNVRKSGGPPADYYVVVLEDVFISSFTQKGDDIPPDDVPVENFSLNFAKITYSHFSVDAGGQRTEVKAGWDLAKGKGA